MPEAINRSYSSPNSYYDSEGGLCVAPPNDGTNRERALTETPTQAPTPHAEDCNAKAAQAGLVCARAVAGALELGPSVVGGLVAAFLGGAACGFALSEWSECERTRTKKP